MISYFIIVMISLTGCGTSIESIEKQYSLAQLNDGISEEEAVLIAQHSLIHSRYKGNVDVLMPQVISDDDTKKFPRVYFIVFIPSEENTDIGHHVVVVDKSSGGIIRSQVYWPDKQEGFAWLFAK